MTFLTNIQVKDITDKLTDNEVQLKKIFRIKKVNYRTKTAPIEDYDVETKKGWEVFSESTNGLKLTLRKKKENSVLFEDRIWCMFYNLGFKHLNLDANFNLPHGKNPNDTKQIDVVSIDHKNKIIFLVECKSSVENTKRDFKNVIESMSSMQQGFINSMHEVFGREYKIKLILATENYRVDVKSKSYERLKSSGIFYLNNKGCEYVERIITNYKDSAHYQFLGIVFKGKEIRKENISVPALKGKMGNLDYYMFALQPSLLLQIGFVLHRVKANEVDFPTYQRMLVPNRLKNIAGFLNKEPNEEGIYNFFPNSVIVNFSKDTKCIFEPGHPSRDASTKTKFGMLQIPMAFGIANIIDGQHRIYGYSATDLLEKDTIPVVAFTSMSTEFQLKMFMDVNQNQKAVSPSLRLALQADLHWESVRLDSRMGALKSAIITALGDSSNSILFGKISIGEDKAKLTFPPFYKALGRCLLIPSATQSKFDKESSVSALYDIHNHDHSDEMKLAKERTVDFINSCYEFIEERYPLIYDEEVSNNLIISNRGSYSFIMLIGSFHDFLVKKGDLSIESTNEERILKMDQYLDALCSSIDTIDKELKNELITQLGQAAENLWFFSLQSLVNKQIPEYKTEGLIDWRERKDLELQIHGGELIDNIEVHIKRIIINNFKILFGEKPVVAGYAPWERECGDVLKNCTDRMLETIQTDNNLGLTKNYKWTDFFEIVEYKKLLKKRGIWTKKPKEDVDDFMTFQEHLTVDLGDEDRKKGWELKWIEKFHSLRNIVKHKGSKEIGLNKLEVDLLESIFKQITHVED